MKPLVVVVAPNLKIIRKIIIIPFLLKQLQIVGALDIACLVGGKVLAIGDLCFYVMYAVF